MLHKIISKCCNLTETVIINQDKPIRCVESYAHVAYWKNDTIRLKKIQSKEIITEDDNIKLFVSKDGALTIHDMLKNSTRTYVKGHCVDFDQDDNFIAIVEEQQICILMSMDYLNYIFQFFVIAILLITTLLMVNKQTDKRSQKNYTISRENICFIILLALLSAGNMVLELFPNGLRLQGFLWLGLIFPFLLGTAIFFFKSLDWKIKMFCGIISISIFLALGLYGFESELTRKLYPIFFCITLVSLSLTINEIWFRHAIVIIGIFIVSCIAEIITIELSTNTYGFFPFARSTFVVVVNIVLLLKMRQADSSSTDLIILSELNPEEFPTE